jgi:hypothetical protein
MYCPTEVAACKHARSIGLDFTADKDPFKSGDGTAEGLST